MKAVRVENGQPTVVDVAPPAGDGVLVNVASASICGSDFHLMEMGVLEGLVIGHELAGTTADGSAVAIDPAISCGVCHSCADGERRDCDGSKSFMGIRANGGMAEQVLVDPAMLVPLPSGLDVGISALVEPLAVAAHAVRRVGILESDRVAVIGAGPIGLAVTAVLRNLGAAPVLFARHDHQKAAGEALGASLGGTGGAGNTDGFDVVIDAVGTTASIAEGVERLKPRGRIGLAGTLWKPASIDIAVCSKEISIIPAAGYSGVAPNRDFDHAARVLAENPSIATTLISHRFPLDGAVEGFVAAADRSGGAIKVLFEI